VVHRKVEEIEGTMEKSGEGKIEKVGKGKEKIERWWGGRGGGYSESENVHSGSRSDKRIVDAISSQEKLD
jgi:hypothetical protein